jgi:uncharacterized damage-inducible protein DinB
MVKGVSAMGGDYRRATAAAGRDSSDLWSGRVNRANLVPSERSMSEIERIWDQLQRSFEGNDAWRCPSLRDLLANLGAAAAAAHPIPGAPSAWELLLHLTVYEDVARRRLAGEAVPSLRGEAAWPVPAETSPAAWLKARLAFGEARRALRQAVAGFPEDRLKDPVPGREYTYYVLLHGVVEHALYHAGQIEMLMVAARVRPSASPIAEHEQPPPPYA